MSGYERTTTSLLARARRVQVVKAAELVLEGGHLLRCIEPIRHYEEESER
jgi:hypothetical protein